MDQARSNHFAVSMLASPRSEHVPSFDIEVGRDLFCPVFDGEPAAANGLLQDDGDKRNVGCKLRPKHLNAFDIIE